MYPRKWATIFLTVLFGLSLGACGSGGDGTTTDDTTSVGLGLAPPAAGTIAGVLSNDLAPGILTAQVATTATEWPSVILDKQQTEITVAADGTFILTRVTTGDHSLFFSFPDGTTTELPLRMHSEGGLNLGMVRFGLGLEPTIEGFDGYMFGFVDADGDGVNDLFFDADGDGIVDMGPLYGGFPFFMDQGFEDVNSDGINDHFMDANGDGFNDFNGMGYGHGFGWMDGDSDGVNDLFVDADGDGICDITGAPFSHPFGYIDTDGDGMNDLFIDADGDGMNDISGMSYRIMPGFVDLDADGVNDFFADSDGNGINDLTGMPFGHGFGWVDADGDGINDNFTDADGDGIMDGHGDMSYGMGFARHHSDSDGNGIDDLSGMPFGHGFGWVDADKDGINDMFVDADGDVINDLNGTGYGHGYMMNSLPGLPGIPSQPSWPMPGPGSTMGGNGEGAQTGSGMGGMM